MRVIDYNSDSHFEANKNVGVSSLKTKSQHEMSGEISHHPPSWADNSSSEGSEREINYGHDDVAER